ncbi:MAG TPA: MotA/TolQ/ExbB proton channel family protein [Fibrobacteraceae bacterium]|jgi:biopolymer transport protein ExbB|nr:MotA/TolQ/ExbB proton channel family protein [Fibrobacteraceae bacterium]
MSNSFYLFIESIWNTFVAGGVVMTPILLTGVIGFYYLYSSWFRIGTDFFKNDLSKNVERMRVLLEKGDVDQAEQFLKSNMGIVARELFLALKKGKENSAGFEDYISIRLLQTSRYIEQGTHVISMMAAAAPLLGLLGTVTGMVATFDVITLYGNQNPVLMADGISEALITTQSGLLIAFPLTLLKQRLDERIDMIRDQIELGATIIFNFIEKRQEA